MQANDKYSLHLLKGKCYDKQQQYKQAALQYAISLEAATKKQLDGEILGQIQFRLGWSIIRSKNNVQKGIEHLQKANELLMDFPELMIMLAGVLFQESGTEEDTLRSK